MTNLDKEILEFGRLKTVVWTRKNCSFNKEKLQQTNKEYIKLVTTMKPTILFLALARLFVPLISFAA